MISKENYEIWMLDYLDGNLSGTERTRLFQFLEQNPHLKEELEGIEKTVLSPPEEVFAPKHNLLKAPTQLSGITYPEYVAITEIENGLDADEHHWKTSYLKQDKSHATIFTLYSKVILKADQSLRYPFKARLKRVVMMPVLRVSTWRRIRAAAAIAILLSIGSVTLVQKIMVTDHVVAVNDTPLLLKKPSMHTEIETPLVVGDLAVRSRTSKTPILVQEGQKSAANQNPSFEAIEFETIKMEPLSPQKIHPIKTQNINAYELGLNTMMPFVIANNLIEKKEDRMAIQSHLNQQSEQLTRSARIVTGSVKVINFLAGNKTKVNKVLNPDGQIVAYQVESDNISIRRRIKNMPVTN